MKNHPNAQRLREEIKNYNIAAAAGSVCALGFLALDYKFETSFSEKSLQSDGIRTDQMMGILALTSSVTGLVNAFKGAMLQEEHNRLYGK